jgi:hypothetical protein
MHMRIFIEGERKEELGPLFTVVRLAGARFK